MYIDTSSNDILNTILTNQDVVNQLKEHNIDPSSDKVRVLFQHWMCTMTSTNAKFRISSNTSNEALNVNVRFKVDSDSYTIEKVSPLFWETLQPK